MGCRTCAAAGAAACGCIAMCGMELLHAAGADWACVMYCCCGPRCCMGGMAYIGCGMANIGCGMANIGGVWCQGAGLERAASARETFPGEPAGAMCWIV